MTPILYEKDEIDFTSQGLGALAEIYDVDVAEQRNGLFQLTANYPVTGIRYDDISVGRIILAKPNQRDEPHAFRIVNTELDVMGYSLMIEADSITYDLNHNFVKHLSVSDATGQAMMSAIQSAIVNPSIFTFYSDINHKSSTKLDYVNPMEAVMGVQGSFLQYWGGELKRENRRVAMFNRRGRDNVATFRLGKNISGLKYKVDISSLVTRIVPVKSVQENDKTTYLEGTPVSSKYIDNYEQIYTIKVDFTDESIKTVDDLNKAAEGWFVDSANTGRDKPSVTIDIDVLSLQDSADYQDKFKNLESVALTDTVTVYVPEYGVNVTAIVNEIHFDPIQERVTKLVVGTAKHSFADSSRVQLSDLQGKIISVQEQADQIAVSANGKNSNYYGSVAPSHPQQGDLWYWVNGDLSGIKQFVDGEWVDLVDSNTQQQITDSVNKAVSDAKEYSDKLVADNAEQVNRVLSDVQDKQVELKNEQLELDRKAQEYANKALSDAKADAQETVAQSARDAQQALANAKTELTENLSNEIRDRAKALSDLDQKATDAINKAKEDAQSALNALQIGGRNYLLNSNGSSLSGWSAPSLWSVTNDPIRGSVFMGQPTVTWTGGGMNSLSQATTNVPVGSVVTVSFYAKADVDNARFHSEPLGTVVSFNPRLTTEWVRYTYTYTMGANNQRVYFMPVDAGTTYYLDDIKLEIGNKATDYTQSPEDVVMDYTTKDDEIKRTLTQYQETNDDRVSKAESAVSQAVGELATKVSKTTFDQKTGQLQSDLNTTTNTANSAKQDISRITSDNQTRDSKINSLISDATETKRTISSLSGDLNTVSGDVSTLKQTANGFEATVNKVNNMSIGGRNYVLNSSGLNGSSTDRPALSGVSSGANVLVSYPADGILMTNGATNKTTEWYYQVASAWAPFTNTPLTPGGTYSFSADVMGTVPQAVLRWGFNGPGGYESFKAFDINNTGWTRVSVTMSSNTTNTGLYFRIQGGINNQYSTGWAGGETLKFRYIKIEDGNLPTAWTPAPEDLESATAHAQYTADEATSTISKYKTSNDDRISTAESKIKQNAEAITSKVSQTEYNQKTGQIEGDISTFRQTATEISKTVANVKGQVDSLQIGGRNYILNSSGLSANATTRPGIPDSISSFYNSSAEYQNDGIQLTVGATNQEWYYAIIEAYGQLSKLTQFVPGKTYTLSVDAKGTAPGIAFRVNNAWSSHHQINDTSWTRFSYTFTLPENATTIYARINASNGTPGVQNFTAGQTIKLRNFKLEDGNMPTAWTPAPEDAESKIATQQITINGITEAVSKHTSDINSVTSRVTTAEGTITTTKNKVDDLESTQTQTAKQITSEVNDRKNGDTNTLTQANNFTASSINSSAEGLRSQITQTADAILARVESTNMVVNSEFDPLDGTWYQIGTGAPVGTKLSAAWKVSPSSSFADWPVVNGSRVISYSTGNWYSSTLIFASAGKAFSASIVAGRASATASTALDFRIAFWDTNKSLIGTMSSGNIIDGSGYKGIQKYVVENKVAPANTRYVSVVIAHSSGNASDFITRPSLNVGEKASLYAPTYGTNASSTILSLLKDNWSIGIADNAGKLASGVFGDINGMALNGKTVTINANQTVITGTAFITDAMISTMSASKLTAGTIDASNINVMNINANNIVSGAISGANLNINLNTGQVVFQRGRIYNTDIDILGGIDINIDSKYISVSSSDTKVLIKGGELGFVEPTIGDLNHTPYLKISNTFSGTSLAGATFNGRNYAVLTNDANKTNLFVVPMGVESFSGISTGKTNDWEPTKVGGAERGVVISGGAATDGGAFLAKSPMIYVGGNSDGSRMKGDRIYMWSSYTHMPSSYNKTTGSGANVHIAADGAIVRSSSSSKYKLDIEYEQQADTANRLLTLDPATWHDKFESEQLDKFHEIGVGPERAIDMSNRRYYGIIAEDLVKAGLEHLVNRNVMTGEVEGVEYSKIGVALIPIIRELRNRLNEQYVEIERLKEQLQ